MKDQLPISTRVRWYAFLFLPRGKAQKQNTKLQFKMKMNYGRDNIKLDLLNFIHRAYIKLQFRHLESALISKFIHS